MSSRQEWSESFGDSYRNAPGSDMEIAGPAIGAGSPEIDNLAESTAPGPEFVEWSMSSRTGSIVVRTTEQGLPLGIAVDPAELKRDPRVLASEVFRLATQAANRAALARRREFEEAGVAPDALRLMGLPTEDEVAQSELQEEEYETEPESWLRLI